MQFAAAAIVNGAVNPSFENREGFSGIVRNDPGDYTLTLDNAYAPTEICVQCTLAEDVQHGVVVGVKVQGIATTTIQIKWLGPGDVGVDVDYSVLVVALAVN